MSDPVFDLPPPDDRSDLVCFCMAIDRGTVRGAIAAGAHTIEAIQDTTFACTGCGTCREEILGMIEAFLLRSADEQPPPPEPHRDP